MYEVVSLFTRSGVGCEIICIKEGGCQTVGPNSAGKVTNGVDPVLGQILFLEEKIKELWADCSPFNCFSFLFLHWGMRFRIQSILSLI